MDLWETVIHCKGEIFMSKTRAILKLFFRGASQRKIAVQLRVSRNTVARTIAAAEAHKVSADELDSTVSDMDLEKRLFGSEEEHSKVRQPDCAYIHKELLKKGVTLKLLWTEYAAECRQIGSLHLMYSQYCKVYRDYVDQHRLTMHIRHKPGDRIMVDWAGATVLLHNPVTGEESKAHIFVATLPFSMYCYAEACRDMKETSWINAHIRMFEFFGGTARILVPDNLKTGIIVNKKHEDPVANRAYQEMADHYRVAILPARVRAPKDKAAVEGSVGQITTHILAKLRNRKFFSLEELNKAILEELEAFNHAPFQKKDGTRASVFHGEESPFLQPLPKIPYRYATWKQATVQLNYHVTLEYQNYSVPYAYARKRVDVRIADRLVEVYCNGQRIASHKRLVGRRGQYATVIDHMPPNHRLYSEWNGDRFRSWARKIGPATFETVDKQLMSYAIEEQGYKGCLALLKLADQYGKAELETACSFALRQVPTPRYKFIRSLLCSGKIGDATPSSEEAPADRSASHAFVRGAAYYGGEDDDK